MRWLKVNFSEPDLNAIRLVCTVLNKVWNTLTLYCLLVFISYRDYWKKIDITCYKLKDIELVVYLITIISQLIN